MFAQFPLSNPLEFVKIYQYQKENTEEVRALEAQQNKKFPRIGQRNVKTAISATLCAVIYELIDRNPTFACIGAVFGMDNTLENSWRTGGNRLVGTIIGGFLGMGFFYITSQVDSKPFQMMMLFVGIMALIYISQLFRFAGAIQAGSVVFYIVMLNTPEHQYVSYALNRMLDTGIGVIMSIGINVLLPRHWINQWRDRMAGLVRKKS